MGQSLNGLGESRGTITILSVEDAKELEKTYIDEMLNLGTWWTSGETPTIVLLGGKL